MVKLPFDIKDIKPGEFSYLSKRKLNNRKGEETGEIFIWKKKGELEHSFSIKCPHCLSEENGTVVLNRRPYRLRCPNCNRSITLKKLKDL